VREAVYDHAFEKGSHRVGRSQLDLETKVKFGTRAWVLHNMTEYPQELESEREDLYQETIGAQKDYGDRWMRQMAYDEYYGRKEELIETLKDQYFKEVDEITAPWRK
jgi:hypothetical protein